MEFIRSLVTNHSTLYVATVIVGGYVLWGVGLAFLVRWIRGRVRREVPDTDLSMVFTICATIFGLLLGFLVVTVWQRFDLARENVDAEANSVQYLDRLSSGETDVAAVEYRDTLKAYATDVVVDEWPKLAAKGESDQAVAAMNSLWAQTLNRPNDSASEVASREQFIIGMQSLEKYRQARILASQSSLPRSFIVFLTFYSIFLLFLLNLFRATKFGYQVGMAAVLGMTIGSILLLIVLIDYPFAGATKLQPEAFSYLLQHMK